MQDAQRFDTGAATHVGRVREHNEDSYLARPDAGIWAGVGTAWVDSTREIGRAHV